MTPFCECEEMTGVLRDMYATRVQCSCRDAYKKSPERNNNDSTMSNLTQEQVSELSDFEINKGIAEFLNIYMSDNGFGAVRVWVSGVPNSIKGVAKDYCNNWNDLIPLVVDHDIEFFRCSHVDNKAKEYQAFCANPDIAENEAVNCKLERALAECLLQVLIAKGE